MPCYRWIKFYCPLLQTLRLTFSLLKTEDKIVPQHRHIVIIVVVDDVIIKSSTDEWLSIQREILRNCIMLTVLFDFVAFPIKDHRWLSSIPSQGPKIIECMVLSCLSQDWAAAFHYICFRELIFKSFRQVKIIWKRNLITVLGFLKRNGKDQIRKLSNPNVFEAVPWSGPKTI